MSRFWYLFLTGVLLLALAAAPKALAQEETAYDADSDGPQIAAHQWFNDPWSPLANNANLFDLTGALRIVTRFHYNLPATSTVKPAAGEAAMHLRLEPRFIIGGQFEIRSRLDIKGGLGYGQQRGAPNIGWYTLEAMRVNVERLWMELGLFSQRATLYIGRVPRHLGLGIWQNSGNGPEATHGGGIDMVQVAFKLGSIILLPSVEFISSGPTNYYYGGQPLDIDNVDDTWGVSLGLALIDSPQDLAELLRRQETVWNFSASVFYRQQARTWTTDSSNQDTLTRSDGRATGIDFWLGLYRPYFRLEFEGLFYWHRFTTVSYGQVTGVPFALALELSWWPGDHQHKSPDGGYEFKEHRLAHRLGLKLKSGLASGDRAGGFASLEQNITQAAENARIDSFVFHPDYLVDRILFRRILGSVTESFYLRPEIDFLVFPRLLASFALIYSGAVYASGTPGGHHSLGTEFEWRLAYFTKGTQGVAGLEEHQPFNPAPIPKRAYNGLEVALNYNLLVPLSGLNGYLDHPVHLLELSALLTF